MALRKIKIEKAKLRKLQKTKNPFASLVRAIIYQQLSGKAAESIYRKFLLLFSVRNDNVDFPTPKEITKLSIPKFRSAGVSKQKAMYLRDLAQKFLDGTIEPRKFSKMSDEEIKEHLIQVKGIGPWSADMFLIFALNRPNVLPVGDLGIQKGFQKVFELKSLPSEKIMRKLAEPYKGEYTTLALYLWHAADGK